MKRLTKAHLSLNITLRETAMIINGHSYLMSYKIKVFTFLAVILFLLFSNFVSGQSRADLEKERNEIIRKIEQTAEALTKTSQEKNQKLLELNSLEDKISNREDLLENIQHSVKAAIQEIKQNDSLLLKYNKDIIEVKNQYNQLLRYSYLKKLGTNKWVYILSSQSLNDAFLRWRYTKQFEEYTVNKRKEFHTMQQTIDEKNNALKEANKEQEILLQSESKQISILNSEKKDQNKLLGSLSKDESKLKTELNKTKKERGKLNSAIEKVILEELSKRTAAPTSVESEKAIELTGAFADNKGKLPWPVSTGKVKSKFGTQPHPTVKGLKINNNGIDITTERGARVNTIYAGKVIGVTKIPGYDNMVIVQHGDYYTVYSKLSTVIIKKDDIVIAGSPIGTLSPEGNELHIELWKNKNKIDPQAWLQKK